MNTNSTMTVIVYYLDENNELGVTTEVYTRKASVRLRDDAHAAAMDAVEDTRKAYPGLTLDSAVVYTGGRVDYKGRLIEDTQTRIEFRAAALGVTTVETVEIDDEFPALLDAGETVTEDILTDFGDDELSEAMMLHGDEASS